MLNDGMIVNNGLEQIWKEVAEILTGHFPHASQKP
jgi:hypothetical protein